MSQEDQGHQSLIRTPRQLITVIVLAFVVVIVGIWLLVGYVTQEPLTDEKYSTSLSKEAIEARIAPVARVELAAAAGSAAPLKTGQEVFQSVCSTCHGAGIAGAPKFGDASAWAPRIAEGVNTLWEHALKGYQGKNGVMPPKGGATQLSDVEVERAVVYMANAAGAKFSDPPVPAGTQEAAAAAPETPAAPVPPTAPPEIVKAIANANASAAQANNPSADPGQKLFGAVCIACHGAGVNGAPKFGDKAAWAPRIAEGLDTLYDHALHGYQGKNGVMPPKGGSNASDDDVKAAVRYMVQAAK